MASLRLKALVKPLLFSYFDQIILEWSHFIVMQNSDHVNEAKVLFLVLKQKNLTTTLVVLRGKRPLPFFAHQMNRLYRFIIRMAYARGVLKLNKYKVV